MEDHKIVPAKALPEGWAWIEYDDGSGHLEAPDGRHYYSYDLAPYHAMDGIEFRKTDSEQYNIFWKAPKDTKSGVLTEFKEWAERIMQKKLRESIYDTYPYNTR